MRCYLRLSDNLRAREALRQCLPEALRDSTFQNALKDGKKKSAPSIVNVSVRAVCCLCGRSILVGVVELFNLILTYTLPPPQTLPPTAGWLNFSSISPKHQVVVLVVVVVVVVVMVVVVEVVVVLEFCFLSFFFLFLCCVWGYSKSK